MNDTITTAPMTTRMMRSDIGITLPADTRVRVVRIEGSDTLQQYVGEIGTVVSHTAGTQPLVKFDITRSNDDRWYVTQWNVLPNVGQRVRVVECQDAAQEGFKDWATGRECTYLGTGSEGVHVVQFDDPVMHDVPNPAGVLHVDFTIGETPLNPIEPVALVGPTREERERTALRLYETLVEAVNDMAEREEWCGSFETWAENLPYDTPFTVRRTQDKEYSVEISLEYEIDRDTIATFLAREHGGDHDNVEDSVTVTSNVVISMTLSGEDPNDADTYTVRTALNDAGYSGFDDFTIDNFEESY